MRLEKKENNEITHAGEKEDQGESKQDDEEREHEQKPEEGGERDHEVAHGKETADNARIWAIL